jgi:hypothetical protein
MAGVHHARGIQTNSGNLVGMNRDFQAKYVVAGFSPRLFPRG